MCRSKATLRYCAQEWLQESTHFGHYLGRLRAFVKKSTCMNLASIIVQEENTMAANPNPLPDPNEKLVRVFDAEQESEAMVVSGLLESQGIDCEVTALDAPQDVLPIGGTVILVRQEDASRALQLIEEYRRTPAEQLEDQANASAAGTDGEFSE
jgi:hypothetical protein